MALQDQPRTFCGLRVAQDPLVARERCGVNENRDTLDQIMF